ncbi:MAG: hypothetical protein WCA79_21535 [Anaerolineales bacterium]
MGRYSPTTVRPKPQIERPHPVWRGIGCILMIVVPIISFGLAELTIQSNWAQQYVPYQLMGFIVMPAILWKPGFLNPILAFIQGVPNLSGVLVFFFLYLIVIGAFVSVGNAYLYKTLGPPRYGPQDAPQPKIKVKPYKR